MNGCEGRVHARPKRLDRRNPQCGQPRKKMGRVEFIAYIFLLAFASFTLGMAVCIYALTY